jgi:cell division septal protein FtsQ
MKKNYYKKKTHYRPLLIVIGFIVSLFLLSFCFLVGYTYLGQISYFKIKDIDIIGNKAISKQAVVALANCKNRSLFTISSTKIIYSLLHLPLVRTASLKRIWPDKLKIDITEREPLALAYINHQLWLVDSNSECAQVRGFKKLDLPIISGLLSPKDNQLDKTISLLRAWKQKGLSSRVISQIHIDKDLGLSIFTLEGCHLLFGKNEFGKKIKNLQKILDYLGEKSNYIDRIDLTKPNRVYARLK